MGGGGGSGRIEDCRESKQLQRLGDANFSKLNCLISGGAFQRGVRL